MKTHTTVLEAEAVDALHVHSSATIVDATLGAGGHTKKILSLLGEEGTLVAIDADGEAVAFLERLKASNVHLVVQNFRNIDLALKELEITAVDGILADLGWRMEQMGGNGKGFSFQVDEPLLMTYGDPENYLFTAHDIVNDWDERDIHNVLKGYGEERFARRIAKAIVVHREHQPIESSLQLAEIVKDAVPKRFQRGRIHPATLTFQALRIAVNDELSALKEFIQKSTSLLTPSGRLAIITFHSVEDRIVKQAFRELAKRNIGTVLTKKPITPREEEIKGNPRARSAKLRIFQKNEEIQNDKTI